MVHEITSWSETGEPNSPTPQPMPRRQEHSGKLVHRLGRRPAFVFGSETSRGWTRVAKRTFRPTQLEPRRTEPRRILGPLMRVRGRRAFHGRLIIQASQPRMGCYHEEL